ncbi:hypothetical protein, partial [Streptococcus pyogenes]|uniref:hypothetical protein n=1 Tax=Streptococcus pyogenes TaxID=1314 RepID=UPI002175BB5C
FFLARIDMRQEASVQEFWVAELLKGANIVDDYSSLSETEKCDKVHFHGKSIGPETNWLNVPLPSWVVPRSTTVKMFGKGLLI